MTALQTPGAGLVDHLVVRRADPLNCETSIADLTDGVTPNGSFYIRNHFAAPCIDSGRWRLQVRGVVKTPLILALHDLFKMPAKSILATMECAGNGRSAMKPAVPGEQWGLGAVSTAEWTGVPLAEVLRRAGVDPSAVEVVFRGADGQAGERFERSLTIKDARDSDALLAYAMNGAPLPTHHGYPLRVVVPGWYGVASVKWLTEIEVIGHAFRGRFQTEKYVYAWERNGDAAIEPVRHMRVRALITHPTAGQTVELGELAIRGLAWSGVAPIARVEVCVDASAWRPARLLARRSRYSWQGWELNITVEHAGKLTVRARATDQAGGTQPEAPEWNRLGYGNNAIQQVTLGSH